jgi:hypothetical protein
MNSYKEDNDKKIRRIIITDGSWHVPYFHVLTDQLLWFYYNTIPLGESIEFVIDQPKNKIFKQEKFVKQFNSIASFFKIPVLLKDAFEQEYDNIEYLEYVKDIRGSLGDYRRNDSEFILHLRSFANIDEKYIGKKYIINRTKENGRVLSSEKIEEYKIKGYEEIFLEQLPIQEQINLFYNCKEIVGIHGSGLTNILFAGNDIEITEICVNYSFNVFFNLIQKVANITGINYTFKLIQNLQGKNSISLKILN